ncbi:septum formation family protein [Yinghuangia seranimata]|uniref:septum formation family protein n=1 Tax=Yinghuangia seranimata TaxID=408067 RepID=UPI00248B929C|nr:septum formation family protein [Yinghuangia seranimata]MDI2131142.1 septum formation family protein [Yinghuangia seranimata]
MGTVVRRSGVGRSVVIGGTLVLLLAGCGSSGSDDTADNRADNAANAPTSKTVPTTKSTSDGSTWPAFAPGECADGPGTQKFKKVPCSGPHHGESVGVDTMPATLIPTTMDFNKYVHDTCDRLARPRIDKQPNAADLRIMDLAPDYTNWTQSNDHRLTCVIIRKDDGPLTGPLV